VIYLFTAHKKGISSHQLARDLKVTQKTAWLMLQRIREAFSHEFDV
jgi:Mn-dependent DtxR family transcriptional regulator